MNSEQETSKQDEFVEKIIYVFFVGLLAYLITNQLIGAVLPPDRYAGFLFVISLPAVFVLSALSFVVYKLFKAQENIVFRYSVLVANSLFASVLGILITYPFVSR
jgi:hypothetical protein